MLTERRLIKGCKKYNKAAQKELYEQYAPIFKGICLRFTGNLHEAEDVLHECFIKIFTKIGQYKGSGSFEGWMKRLVVNTSISWVKANKNLAQSYEIEEYKEQSDEANSEFDPENSNIKTIVSNADFTEEDIMGTINKLPDGFRMVFNLYVFENYKHKEIAEILGIDENTSKSQLSRARKLIQKNLYEICKEKFKLN